jgi:hypothetical protein
MENRRPERDILLVYRRSLFGLVVGVETPRGWSIHMNLIITLKIEVYKVKARGWYKYYLLHW